MEQQTTVNNEEVEKFSKIADEWWNPNGKFRPLHKINPIRIEYIQNTIFKYLGKNLADLNILDIGCGGGLITEPFSKLGAKVTGIDASEKNIKTAQIHSNNNDLKIDYIVDNIENFAKSGKKFDIILALEIIEHVDNPDIFIESCNKVMKNNGLIILSTLNRTFKSYLEAIIGAEYILKWLPKNTHNWNKFFKPSEIIEFFTKNNIKTLEIKGMTYNIFKDNWLVTDNVSVNYFIVGKSENN